MSNSHPHSWKTNFSGVLVGAGAAACVDLWGTSNITEKARLLCLGHEQGG